MDSARINEGERITRQQRSALRFARFIYEGSRLERVFQAPIYDGMTYNIEDNEEFSDFDRQIPFNLSFPRFQNLAVSKDEIKDIILGGGEKFIPESNPTFEFHEIIHSSTELFGR